MSPHTGGWLVHRQQGQNSNVVKFFGLLRKDCPEQQVAYYQVRLLVPLSRCLGFIFSDI